MNDLVLDVELPVSQFVLAEGKCNDLKISVECALSDFLSKWVATIRERAQ